MPFWKCKHPAASLIVEKPQTTERKDADFEVVTYHLICNRCSAEVKVKHSRFVGGVLEFLKRGARSPI